MESSRRNGEVRHACVATCRGPLRLQRARELRVGFWGDHELLPSRHWTILLRQKPEGTKEDCKNLIVASLDGLPWPTCNGVCAQHCYAPHWG